MLDKLAKVAVGHESTVFAGMSEDEMDTLERLLGKIYANVTERRTEPA